MEEIKIKGYGKINLTLDVVGKRDNGYHDVEMIMQQVTLYDDLIIKKTSEKSIAISSTSSYIPCNDSNIVYKVIEDMMEAYAIDSGVSVHIVKRIPIAAGMAGGSADAAAAIEGMDKLFELNLSLDEKKKLGLKRGADIPFCIEGGTCLAEGIGEELTNLHVDPNYWILLVKPAIGVSTKDVYQALEIANIVKHPNTEGMINGLRSNNVYEICSNLGNVLEDVTVKMHPIILAIKKKMIEFGANGSMMSGSGPTVFGIFTKEDRAKKAMKNMSRFYKETYLVRPRT